MHVSTTTANPAAIPIRIVIADDHSLFLECFRLLINRQPGMEVIGEAHNGKHLIQEVAEKSPDIVITDINMPQMCGVEATRIIRSNSPATGVIALSMCDEEEMVFHMLEAGAKGYLLKNSNEEEVVHAIHAVNDNGVYYCSTTSNKLVRLMARSSFNPYKPGMKPDFTEREIQIMGLICRELCSKEIAGKLGINFRSVESARERIQEKIGARNMIGIAVYAIRHGIFSVD